MTASKLVRDVRLGACAAAAMLAGCSSANTPFSPVNTAPAAERMRPPSNYSVLYSFQGGSGDGEGPLASLVNVGGTLYGTASGGAHKSGIVFSITASGKESLLYSFGGGKDGAATISSLVNVNGTLYGTTWGGGVHNTGTVFKVTTSGTQSVLHSFGGAGDGEEPESGLINVGGTLYGTTLTGGPNCYDGAHCGTVYSITTSGKETVLYNFEGGSDGQYPYGPLTNVNGTLYGTTLAGGAYGQGAGGDGTVFSVTTSGTEAVLHSFGGSGDGTLPYAGLVDAGGTLYGTTYKGGAHKVGVVFSITTSGVESVLHSFGGSADGDSPNSGLIDVKNTLYGVTPYGTGADKYGTIYKISTSGAESVLHTFGGTGDGKLPEAGLLDVSNTLYGTTDEGGAKNLGTVFSLSL